MTRFIIILTGLLLFSSQVSAVVDESALKLVQDTTGLIMEKLQQDQAEIKKNPQRVTELVEKIVLPHFDFIRMSQWTLGKYWTTAKKDQQDKFVKEFRMLLVRTYAKALADNVGKPIEYKPLRKGDKNDSEVTVFTEVQQQAGFPIPITYKMQRNAEENWKVFDVIIDGISLVANYRTSFAKEIRQSGIDVLIASLATRNQQ